MRSVVPMFAGILFVAACSGTAPRGTGSADGGSDGGCLVPDGGGCAADETLDCSGGGQGFACVVGENPETENPTLACSTPQVSECGASYCCFTGIVDSPPCATDNAVTAACPNSDPCGFQCNPGGDPSADDPLLHCSPAMPDGMHDDFCCAFAGSDGGTSSCYSSVPTGCMVDPRLDCSGGADGYSCDAGANPENEDPALSCSTPQADATTGGDDFCCFREPSGDFSPSTCVADDDLTSVCPDADSYGYQCVSGDDPSTLDSSLTSCSRATPDADGVHDDFCCTYD